MSVEADDYANDNTRYDGFSKNNNNKEENKMADVTEKDIFDLRGDIKDARYDVNSRIIDSSTGLSRQVDAIDDTEINALKTQVELAKQSTYLSDKIDAGNQRTVDLINANRDSDQNRMLVERNTELVAALADGRWYGDWGRFRGAYDSNIQAVNSRLNSVDSQFEATRQGMVNFGTMAGVGQSSTSNNVK